MIFRNFSCAILAIILLSCRENPKGFNHSNPSKIVAEIDVISLKGKDEFDFDLTSGPGEFRYKGMVTGSFLSQKGLKLNHVKVIGSLDSPVAYFYCEPLTPVAYVILAKETKIENLMQLQELSGRIGEKVIDRVYIYSNR